MNMPEIAVFPASLLKWDKGLRRWPKSSHGKPCSALTAMDRVAAGETIEAQLESANPPEFEFIEIQYAEKFAGPRTRLIPVSQLCLGRGGPRNRYTR